MEQTKVNSPRLFVCTAIENKDEIEEVVYSFSQFPTKNHIVGHVNSYFIKKATAALVSVARKFNS